MAEERDYILTLVSGKKRSGKTYRTKQEVDAYSMSDPRIGRQGKKVLIFDTQLEDHWSGYKTLYYDADEENEFIRAKAIIAFTKSPVIEIRRIIPRKRDGMQMTATDMVTAIQTINKFFRKGLLVLEDINKIIQTSAQQVYLTDALISTRHIQQDIILHYQSLGAVPPKMYQNAEIIRFHKQADSIDRYKNRIPCFEILKLGEITVNRWYKQGHPYIFVYLSPTEEKIYNVPWDEFKITCEEYLLSDSSLLKSLTNKLNIDGTKKFPTPESAINNWIEEHKYYWVQPQ
uniref:Uncharacterized protein n=1 Tax=viral metagenome TaxID=1070528 RepID=A0A6M3KGD0_9ZZZZ